MIVCEICKHRDKMETEYPCSCCVHACVDKYEPITNHERITSMSIGDFVEWLLTDWEKLKFSFTQTDLGMREWLDKPFVPTEFEGGRR